MTLEKELKLLKKQIKKLQEDEKSESMQSFLRRPTNNNRIIRRRIRQPRRNKRE